MGQSEFSAQVREVLRDHKMHDWSADKLTQLLQEDVTAGAQFTNMMGSFAPNDLKKALAITTRGVWALKRGMLGMTVLWVVPVKRITRVEGIRDPFRTHIADILRIVTSTETRDVTFGFFEQGTEKADLARNIVKAARTDIEHVVARSR